MECRPIVILGPTAGGKSDLAAALAARFGASDGRGAEILGADSMQVYRGMDAGTAKPSPALREAVRHHLIDIVEPDERFTVADWVSRADALIESLRSRGVRPIVVGGTNLYLKALLEGLLDGPAIDEAFRASLAEVAPAELHARLAKVDADAAARIHPNDRKRLTRALEVHHLTGEPISRMQQHWDSFTRRPEPSPTGSQIDAPSVVESLEKSGESASAEAVARGAAAPLPRLRHDALLVGLRWPVATINRRINLRVKAMFDPEAVRVSQGLEIWEPRSLPDEVADLLARDRLGPPDAQARQALGYKQVLAAMDGQMTMEEAFERTKILTRRFAKQQRTWLKRFAQVRWLEAVDGAGEARDVADLADEAAAWIASEDGK